LDSNHEFEKAAARYTELANEPGWRDYCRDRVEQLDNDPSGLYRGLLAEVRKRLEAAKAKKVQGL